MPPSLLLFWLLGVYGQELPTALLLETTDAENNDINEKSTSNGGNNSSSTQGEQPVLGLVLMNYTGDLDADMVDWAMRKKFMHNCTEDMLSITKKWDLFAARYVFPVQFVAGTIGNVLNLCVLMTMNSEMSVANILFAGVALADLGLLTSMSTTILGAWPAFYMKNSIRWFYYHTHFITLYLSNTFLCISSWFVSAVSIERFLSIRDPIRLHREANPFRTYVIVASIVFGSCLLNVYHLFEYKYGFTFICDGTILFGLHHSIFMLKEAQGIPDWQTTYVHINKILQIFLAVFMPLALITVLNVQIIFLLKGSRGMIATPRVTAERDRVVSFRTSTEEARLRRDRKISITIVTIISFYILTHAPSTVPFFIEIFKLELPNWMKSWGNTIMIYWLLCGKVMNFVLFCLTSKYFRGRLRVFAQQRLNDVLSRCGLATEKKYSMISNGRTHSMKMRMLRSQRYSSNATSDQYTEVEIHPRLSKDE